MGEDKKVICGCSAFPHWGSNYIARDLCAGHRCDSEQHPVLDYDEKEGQCVCRVNPCWDIGGNAHSCKEGFPILRYREDTDSDGSAKPVCECVMKIDKPKPRKRPE